MTRRSADIAGATALVTGASSGIGAEIARCLAQRGVRELILVARRRNRLESLAANLALDGVTCRVDPVDLADGAAVDALIARHPRVDLLVNDAGFGCADAFEATDPDLLQRMLAVNCAAVVRLCRAWVPAMASRGSGGVLLVGSTAGFVPMPGMAAYSATKAFVHSLAEGLRAEVGPRGVRVHLLAPGPVTSEFFAIAHPGAKRPPDALFLPARRVATEGVDAWLDGQAERIPGLPLRLGIGTLRTMPSALVRPLLAFANRRLIRT